MRAPSAELLAKADLVRSLLAETVPGATVTVHPNRWGGTVGVHIGPKVPRTPEGESIGRLYYRAYLLARQALQPGTSGGRCWDCWWAEKAPGPDGDCGHEQERI